jgi:hypothetical protein
MGNQNVISQKLANLVKNDDYLNTGNSHGKDFYFYLCPEWSNHHQICAGQSNWGPN